MKKYYFKNEQVNDQILAIHYKLNFDDFHDCMTMVFRQVLARHGVNRL